MLIPASMRSEALSAEEDVHRHGLELQRKLHVVVQVRCCGCWL